MKIIGMDLHMVDMEDTLHHGSAKKEKTKFQGKSNHCQNH